VDVAFIENAEVRYTSREPPAAKRDGLSDCWKPGGAFEAGVDRRRQMHVLQALRYRIRGIAVECRLPG